jgi:hypothetical protein
MTEEELVTLDILTRPAPDSSTDAIKDLLNAGLPSAYSIDLYKQKWSARFDYFYESYPERHKNLRLHALIGSTV